MSKKNIFSKIPNQGKTIFAIMSELAQQHQAIDLSRGFPDFNTHQELMDLYCSFIQKGYNQYAPVDGLMSLRERIAEMTQSLYQAEYLPDSEITITGGATEALFTAITAFVREGDEVLIFEPAYDSYSPAVKLNGGIPAFIEMPRPNYSFDWESLQRAITGNTRMIILNNPHNPTGAVMSAWDVEKLSKIVKGTNILLLSDEVYEHVVFDGASHESLALYPKLKDRTVIVNSFGKTFHVTGWRIGYVLAPKELMNEFRKIHQFLMYTVNTPVQYAFEEFLKTPHPFQQIKEMYQRKRDILVKGLEGTKFKVSPSKGTYFQCVDYAAISDEKDFEFASRLIRENNVASIPTSYFYKAKNDNKVIRFCFAKQDETLYKALEQLSKI
ncbi:MAG TPA: methionine aminotransferase [Marinilabiliales bacterium]|jgi:methionine aminotransferase|nr:MAG: methionine aminotransferase [Bacteroidetes bacterium GWA2_40_14]OFX57467.1 MAG: methionine aminotransferase [Bacteroidetes bacterium GWC2_40_13]OFX71691.1 MAG: methionine aminotransferase [Bacteroidetes bacterium GWD2_40_43]OFX90230.1 MAG: methionine aminotransferase [Bacteroidetes bacterium GWE2_40_63]OFY18624.1 MAG: methionine aminotransferase [Bacteroidetes bacterium GWF2_40_13]OFZ27692.1 MAG: methionine aminotransferase [Bacteroidetes bacterium RIFOXYC2_FULL_40_12]HAM99721.1 methi